MSLAHQFVTAKADGGDATLVKPSNWNAVHAFAGGTDGQKLVRDATVSPDGHSWQNGETCNLTNKTGIQLAIGSVVALSTANDAAVVLDDTKLSVSKFCVAMQAINDGAVGMFTVSGEVAAVISTGAIARGQYVRKSATARAVEDAGVTVSATTPPPAGAVGIALNAAAANIVTLFLYNKTVATPAGVPTNLSLTTDGTRNAVSGNNNVVTIKTINITKLLAGTKLAVRVHVSLFGTWQSTDDSRLAPLLRVTVGATNFDMAGFWLQGASAITGLAVCCLSGEAVFTGVAAGAVAITVGIGNAEAKAWSATVNPTSADAGNLPAGGTNSTYAVYEL